MGLAVLAMPFTAITRPLPHPVVCPLPHGLQKKGGGKCGAVAKVPINDPKLWRERAEEARTKAEEITDPDSKRRMLRLARDYEELARRAERRLKRKP